MDWVEVQYEDWSHSKQKYVQNPYPLQIYGFVRGKHNDIRCLGRLGHHAITANTKHQNPLMQEWTMEMDSSGQNPKYRSIAVDTVITGCAGIPLLQQNNGPIIATDVLEGENEID